MNVASGLRRAALRSALHLAPLNDEVISRELEKPRLASFYGGKPISWQRVTLRLPTSHGNVSGSDVTVLLAAPAENEGVESRRRPAVLLLHSTGKSKEFLLPHLERLARKGFVAAAFDARYHGERALPDAGLAAGALALGALGPGLPDEIVSAEPRRQPVYHDALVRAWRTGDEKPFLYDSVADASHVLTYLSARPDVLPSRIGVAGVSLGGMHAWLLAAADERVAAVAPAIGVQSFRYALEHESWGARVDSIKPLFEAAARDLGAARIDTRVVAEVWRRMVPGLADQDLVPEAFDAPASLGCVAPRPLLILSGERDPRCPIEGVREALASAEQEYAAHGASGHIRHFVEPGVGHEMTARMWQEIDTFLVTELLQSTESKL